MGTFSGSKPNQKQLHISQPQSGSAWPSSSQSCKNILLKRIERERENWKGREDMEKGRTQDTSLPELMLGKRSVRRGCMYCSSPLFKPIEPKDFCLLYSCTY